MMRRSIVGVLAFVVILMAISCSDDDSVAGNDDTTVADADTVTQHQLAPGLWWVEVTCDTSKTDSGNSSVTVTEEHHVRNTVLASLSNDSGAIDYVLEQSDTLYTVDGPQGIEVDTVILRQMGADLYLLLPVEEIGLYLAYVKLYAMPFTVGDSWVMLDESVDSSFRLDPAQLGLGALGLPPVKVRTVSSMSGNASVDAMAEYDFGGETRSCLEITRSSDGGMRLLLDTTIVYNLGFLSYTLAQGDTLFEVSYASSRRELFSSEFALALWSREVESSVRQNDVASTVTDSTTTVMEVTALCDSRWEPADTLYLE